MLRVGLCMLTALSRAMLLAHADRFASHFNNEPQATTKMINSTNEQQAAAKCFQNQEKLFLKEVKVSLVALSTQQWHYHRSQKAPHTWANINAGLLQSIKT